MAHKPLRTAESARDLLRRGKTALVKIAPTVPAESDPMVEILCQFESGFSHATRVLSASISVQRTSMPASEMTDNSYGSTIYTLCSDRNSEHVVSIR